MGDDRITKLTVEVEHIKETLDEVKEVVSETSNAVTTHVAKEQVLRDMLQTELFGIRQELNVYNASLIKHMSRTEAVEVTNETLAILVKSMDERITPFEQNAATRKTILTSIKWTVGVGAGLVAIVGFIINYLL
jgi:uncharacterized coiled-coil protein SlyX